MVEAVNHLTLHPTSILYICGSGFLEDKCVCKGKEAIGAAKQIQSTNVCKWDVEQCYLIEKDKMLAMPGKSKR
jgi:hypothetical protein